MFLQKGLAPSSIGLLVWGTWIIYSVIEVRAEISVTFVRFSSPLA